MAMLSRPSTTALILMCFDAEPHCTNAIAISSGLTLPDGRKLSYAAYGSTSTTAPVVFYHHGFPASHAEARLYDTAAQKHEIRLIAIDRPGMGNSTYQPNRQLLDWPAHLLALTDHLKVEQFGILGTSGGGPYVLACWHSIPRSRCGSAGIHVGPLPEELGHCGYVVRGANDAVHCALAGRAGCLGSGQGSRSHCERRGASREVRTGTCQYITSGPPVDRELWNRDVGGFRQTLVESTRGAVHDGGHGPAWEARLFGSNWGFPLEELSADAGKMFLWHGGADLNVPAHMAETAAKLMNGAELRFSPDEGHASLAVNKSDDIVAALRGFLPT
ncbi:hypothetical protein SUNI508_12637 [Seiridium unicorne]|uniref:AB hydrolase-1 domain-containing protein n=1 Tax=Seiridium unicorne TaxID=138068 RepID=A0ABR2VGN3_9PEZI